MYDIDAAPIVRAVRERANLTQRELAERAGSTQAAVARIESGDANPSLDMLRRLLHAAGYDARIELVERLEADPVIEAYKRDVDRTLLIEQLRKTPEQRMQSLVGMARLSSQFARARRVAERKR